MVAHLVARDVTFSHGPITVLDGVSVTVGTGDRLGIVGPNGVGKSTLLHLLAGQLVPSGGTVVRHPPGLTVGHLSQEPDARPGETVAGLVARRTGVAAAEDALVAAGVALAAGEPGADERYTVALDAVVALGAGDLDAREGEILERVGLGGRAGQEVAGLSGGQRARAELASLLLSRFDVLLLDEPTNDLDLDGLDLLERFVESTASGVAVVSHDRAFLERVTTSVLELDDHHRTGRTYPGGYSAYLHEREVARRHAKEAYEGFSEEKDRLAARARRHREWAATGVSNAKKKAPDNDKIARKAKAQGAEGFAGQASRAERALDRLEVVEKPFEGWELRLRFATAERSGAVVASLSGAVVRRGTFTLGPVDLEVRYGDRVVVTGANGSGKTTLLGALLGDLPCDHGTQRTGRGVVVGRLDQTRPTFGGETSLLDAFTASTGVPPQEARSVLAKVGLGTEHITRTTAALSPGERTRAVLAAFAVQGVNLLVLDEPTNHLDLPAIEQLEAALDAFPATVLLVSHDRRLLERVRATRRLVVAMGQVSEPG